MIRVIIFSIFLLQLHFIMNAQPLIEINTASDFIEIDNIENLYTVSGFEMKRYNSKGIMDVRYSNRINGVITSVDVTNPLRVMVFYRESNVIVFLNQFFTPIKDPIDFFEITGTEAWMAGGSSLGGYWIFCMETQTLQLYNSKNEKVNETQNLLDLTEGNEIDFIREYNQKVYLGAGDRVLVFDQFCSYLTTIHLKDAKNIKMISGQLNYNKNQNLWIYNPVLNSEIEKKVPVAFQNSIVYYYNKRIYASSDNKISIQKIE